ncbi:hypothetical protein T492DRAFT_832536 [Pavlovales sp. CCMP2436]|nr:hypothetical protein T492DRAFT_832536 [Pavlovales sp. CCMP2436]
MAASKRATQGAAWLLLFLAAASAPRSGGRRGAGLHAYPCAASGVPWDVGALLRFARARNHSALGPSQPGASHACASLGTRGANERAWPAQRESARGSLAMWRGQAPFAAILRARVYPSDSRNTSVLGAAVSAWGEGFHQEQRPGSSRGLQPS